MIDDFDLKLSDGDQTVKFAVVAHVEDNDYSWTADAVLRREADGALFFVTDSGCSCYHFGENLTVADLQPIFKIEEAYRLTDDREKLKRSYELGGELVDR